MSAMPRSAWFERARTLTRHTCILVALAVGLLPCSNALADGISLAGGHLAVAAGVGADSTGVAPRVNLDAGLAFWLQRREPEPGWLLGTAVATGFGAWPTYGVLEVGRGGEGGTKGMTLGGWSFAFGGVGRVEPTFAGGVGGRVAFDLLFAQFGLRSILAAGMHGLDGQLMVTAGIGRF